MKYLVNLDLSQNELQNAKVQNLAAAPSSPVKGQIYFNTAQNKAFVYNGSAWIPWEADTSYNAGTQAQLESGTDTENKVWQPKILHDYVSEQIGAVDAMRFKGTIGTGGTITSLPSSHKRGDTYRVITAGTYAGQVCEVGDLIIALGTSGTTASDWTVAQTNIDGAITSISGTTPISVSGTGASRTVSIAAASTSAAGSMSASDKTKLNGIETGAEKNRTYTAVTGKPTGNQAPAFGGTFNISQISQDATGQITATDRTVKIPNAVATTGANGLMSSEDKSTLDYLAGTSVQRGTAQITTGQTSTTVQNVVNLCGYTALDMTTGEEVMVESRVSNRNIVFSIAAAYSHDIEIEFAM